MLRLLSLVVGIVSSIVLARLGGPDVKGVASAFAAANAVGFMVVNFDLTQQVLREHRGAEARGAVLPHLVRAWGWYAAFGAVVLVVGLVGGLPVAWLVVGTFAFLIGTQAGVAATGLAGVVVSAVGAIVQQLSLVATTVLLAAMNDLTIDTVRIGIVVSYLAPLLIYLPFLAKSGGYSKGLPRQRIFDLMRRGSLWQVGRLFQMLIQKIDMLLVFSVLGASAAGVYSVALSTAMLCSIMPAQFANKVLFDSTTSAEARHRGAVRAALLSGLATAVVIGLLGRQGLALLYGPSFAAGYGALLACLLGAVAYGVVQVQSIVIRMDGSWRGLAATSGVGLLVMLACLVVLVPPLGIVGAGLAFSGGTLTSALAGYFVLHRYRADV